LEGITLTAGVAHELDFWIMDLVLQFVRVMDQDPAFLVVEAAVPVCKTEEPLARMHEFLYIWSDVTHSAAVAGEESPAH
jgi:hypothetical protein